jgi:predicted secreted protein
MLRAVLWTTLVTAAIMAVLYVVTNVLGFGFDDIPRMVPDFK